MSHWEWEVLRAIDSGFGQRLTLRRATGLPKTTVSAAARSLLERGLVESTVSGRSPNFRPTQRGLARLRMLPAAEDLARRDAE
ncbi:MarR family transcriptional regulator [Nakamurella leprariae]|uniref:MarR family transcriptional regulator n=1 Tax=Nakamurella leprariae TaxID=2803911 RepID=A0A939BWR6_9ACTN|nr:hypothetical protein [Nakamurella leprariae]MBM9467813.1 hypothetical protein [Nakamurella leprariae]